VITDLQLYYKTKTYSDEGSYLTVGSAGHRTDGPCHHACLPQPCCRWTLWGYKPPVPQDGTLDLLDVLNACVTPRCYTRPPDQCSSSTTRPALGDSSPSSRRSSPSSRCSSLSSYRALATPRRALAARRRALAALSLLVAELSPLLAELSSLIVAELSSLIVAELSPLEPRLQPCSWTGLVNTACLRPPSTLYSSTTLGDLSTTSHAVLGDCFDHSPTTAQ
jgi:hypothetical protein